MTPLPSEPTALNGVHEVLDEDDDHDVLLCLDTSYWGDIEVPLTDDVAAEIARELSNQADSEPVVSLSEQSGNADEEVSS